MTKLTMLDGFRAAFALDAPKTPDEAMKRDIAAAWAWARSLGPSWYVQREDAPVRGRTHSAVRRIVTPFGDVVRFTAVEASGVFLFTATIRSERRDGVFHLLDGSMVHCFDMFLRGLSGDLTGIERVILRDALA